MADCININLLRQKNRQPLNKRLAVFFFSILQKNPLQVGLSGFVLPNDQCFYPLQHTQTGAGSDEAILRLFVYPLSGRVRIAPNGYNQQAHGFFVQ